MLDDSLCVLGNSSALSEGEARKSTAATIVRMHSLSDLL
jgi:hypothetical protein